MTKSINPANTEATGMATLGKYTLVRRFEFPTRQFPADDNAPVKYVQGTSAEYENTGYGIPSLGILANLPKNMVNTTIEKNG